VRKSVSGKWDDFVFVWASPFSIISATREHFASKLQGEMGPWRRVMAHASLHHHAIMIMMMHEALASVTRACMQKYYSNNFAKYLFFN